VGRHQMTIPKSLADWAPRLRARYQRQNRELGFSSRHAHEVFTVTAWGEIPTCAQLLRDFPAISLKASRVAQLKQRLARWKSS
jgi:hypothetical protein